MKQLKKNNVEFIKSVDNSIMKILILLMLFFGCNSERLYYMEKSSVLSCKSFHYENVKKACGDSCSECMELHNPVVFVEGYKVVTAFPVTKNVNRCSCETITYILEGK